MTSAESSVIYSRTEPCMDHEVMELEREVEGAGDNLIKLGIIIGRYGINRSNREIGSPDQAREVIQEYIANLKDQQNLYSEYLVSLYVIYTKPARPQRGETLSNFFFKFLPVNFQKNRNVILKSGFQKKSIHFHYIELQNITVDVNNCVCPR